jgi:hypothetical protein
MRSDDELSPRPTKRRRISHEYHGFSISGAPKRHISPQEAEIVIQISSDASSERDLYQSVEQSSASASPSQDSQVHMDESPSGDIVDTSDNEERLVLYDYDLYRSDAPSPTTYHAPSGRSTRSTSPIAPSQRSQPRREPASSSVTVCIQFSLTPLNSYHCQAYIHSTLHVRTAQFNLSVTRFLLSYCASCSGYITDRCPC